MPNSIVVGMLWGDEGKAKILDELVQEAKEDNNQKVWVVRFQGGPNAGHTMCVRKDDELVKFVTHAAPSGLTSNSEIAIGPHTAFDTEKFMKELNEARELFNYDAGIHISERVGILFDYHRIIDGLQEAKRKNKVGTTKSGIGPFYMDNANRATRITFADYVGDNFHDKLKEVLKQKNKDLEEAKSLIPEFEDYSLSNYIEKLIAVHNPIREELKEFVCRLEYRLREALENGENIIGEGAQGTMLHVNMGTIPDVSSSHLLAPEGLASLGLPRRAFKIYGIEKIYPTRVGNGFMPTLAEDEFGVETQKNSGEAGATTGRKRRVGYPDWVISKYAAMLNDLDGIYLTRADCVQDKDLKVCTAYEIDGQEIAEVPLKLEIAKPFYSDKTYRWHLWDGTKDLSDPLKADKELAEKRKSLVEAGRDGLPEGLREFVENHDEYVRVPTIGVSIGPARGETIKLYKKYRPLIQREEFV